MTFTVPTFEPEVIKAAARQWQGDTEKVPTTSLRITTHRGVDLHSRYSKAVEVQTMVDVVDNLADRVAWTVQGIAYDSEVGEIEVTAECGPLGVGLLAREIRATLLRIYGHHPPVFIKGFGGAEASLEAEQGL